MRKKALVVHSGGMDSSICLALAINEFQRQNVLSVSFNYSQRHSNELVQAKKICRDWGVDHIVLNLNCLEVITESALIGNKLPIEVINATPTTLVVGRNGLMARLAGIHAHQLGAEIIYMGVLGLEGNHSGYRDCSREYMDLMEKILRLDFANPHFTIRTPLVFMTKCETLELAESLGVLDYLLEETITCYEGISHSGCKVCPACILKNDGIKEFNKNRNYNIITD